MRDRYKKPGNKVRLLPGCNDRPWLDFPPRESGRKFGNETFHQSGRVMVNLVRSHPCSNTGGWQYRYTLVLFYAGIENSNMHVHHKDGDKSNDRLGNLELRSNSSHNRYHARRQPRDSHGLFTNKKQCQCRCKRVEWFVHANEQKDVVYFVASYCTKCCEVSYNRIDRRDFVPKLSMPKLF